MILKIVPFFWSVFSIYVSIVCLSKLFRASIENILPLKFCPHNQSLITYSLEVNFWPHSNRYLSGVYFPFVLNFPQFQTGLFGTNGNYILPLFTYSNIFYPFLIYVWSVFPICPKFSTISNWTIWHQWELYTPIIRLQKMFYPFLISLLITCNNLYSIIL